MIEIVVAITIITMLMSAVGVYALGVYRREQVRIARTELHSAASALDMYRASHGAYPDPGEGFAPVIKARALKTLPKDPWGHPLLWALKDGEPVVISLGADGERGGTDDNADLTSADLEN